MLLYPATKKQQIPLSNKTRTRATEKKNSQQEPPEQLPASPLLMWTILRGGIWLDRCLQENLEARGWPTLSRTESQIMVLASAGITRQVEISKALGLTRQAINQTLGLLKEKGLIDLLPDPDDGRCKIIAFSKNGRHQRQDALSIIDLMEAELARRIGRKTLAALKDGLDRDWGCVPIFGKE